MRTDDTQTCTVVLNGEERSIPRGLSVAGLLEHLEIRPDRVAVELNRALVRKPDWERTPVEPAATVEIVQFVGGG